MSIFDEIEQQRKDAKTALLAGNFDEAIRIATATLGDLAIAPDGESAGDAGAKLTWDRTAIVEFINKAKDARSDAHLAAQGPSGMAISQVQYTRGRYQ